MLRLLLRLLLAVALGPALGFVPRGFGTPAGRAGKNRQHTKAKPDCKRCCKNVRQHKDIPALHFLYRHGPTGALGFFCRRLAGFFFAAGRGGRGGFGREGSRRFYGGQAMAERNGKGFEALIAYVDGASSGNPGPAGAGFVLRTPDGEVVAERAIPLGEATNNAAEYKAVIAALNEAAAKGARRVVVRSDSQLLVRQMLGEYRVKNEGLKPLYEWVKKLTNRFEGVKWEHIPREQNAEADRLARQGAEKSKEGAGRGKKRRESGGSAGGW